MSILYLLIPLAISAAVIYYQSTLKSKWDKDGNLKDKNDE